MSGTGEVRTTSASGGQKGVKPEAYDLIPVEALAHVARVFGAGAAKYSAHNYRKGFEWSKSYAALQRHANAFWRGEDTDPEMGTPHMAHVVFHALALLTFMDEHPEYDDRYRPPVAGAEKDTKLYAGQYIRLRNAPAEKGVVLWSERADRYAVQLNDGFRSTYARQELEPINAKGEAI